MNLDHLLPEGYKRFVASLPLAPGSVKAKPRRPSRKRRSPFDWPLWFRPLKVLARTGDKGLGDIAARWIHRTPFPRWKSWLERKDPKVKCAACKNRQDGLNRRYPLLPVKQR